MTKYFLINRFTSVGAICELLTETYESDAHAVGRILDILLEDDCVSVDYETVLREERQTEWNATAVVYGLRQYSYQSCSQFVWYHSSNSRFQPFGSSFPVEFIYRACEDVFGLTYGNRILKLTYTIFSFRFISVSMKRHSIKIRHDLMSHTEA